MSDTPRLEALISRHQELHSQGQSITVEELCLDCPELVPVLRARLAAPPSQPAVPQTIELPAAAGLPVTREVVPTLDVPAGSFAEVAPHTRADAEPEQTNPAAFEPPARSRHTLPSISGYQVQGELGRGGMGVVYKARHLRLNRMVALKMVLTGVHAGPTELARFHIEAEAVASLQHPNIIQVFEVGEHDNCPFLALEYVEGGGLDRLLAGKPQPPRDAAVLVEVLARAMHAAHLRGIVHRDLKPANILLQIAPGSPGGVTASPASRGLYGVPKITDFGLAKRAEGDTHTRSGSVLGTPGYMAPEQALGQLRDIGPHSDVYSLGAILYEMLAGVPPFRAGSIMETLTLSATEEARPPSQAGAGPLPRDLETICLKCLQKDPKKRYLTAEELADDLRRFLDDEPIRARPVGRVERLRKWVRRRPAAAALVGVSVLAAVLLLSLGVWSNARLRAARDRAERRSQIARAAVDDMYTRVAEKWLGDEPQMDDLQRQFLLKAATVYEELADDDEQNPGLRRETGQALVRVGRIYRQLRRMAEAEKAFDRAIALQQELREKNPATALYRQDLANTYNWRGELFRTSGQLPEALASYAKALPLQEALAKDFPDEPVYRQELARSHYNRGLALGVSGKNEKARKDYERAIALLGKVVAQVPRQPGPRVELARAYLNLGALLDEPDNAGAAKKAYEQALKRQQQLVAEYPGKPAYRYELASTWNSLGNLRGRRFNDLDGAKKAQSKARELLALLSKDYPARPDYRGRLANTWNSIGAILAQEAGRIDTAGIWLGPVWGRVGASASRQRWAEAGEAWRRAGDLYRTLARQWPDVPDYQDGSGRASFNRGWLALHQGRTAEARGYLEEAIRYQRQALRITPQSKTYRRDLSNQYRWLARALRRLKDPTGATAAAAAANRYKDSPKRQRQSPR